MKFATWTLVTAWIAFLYVTSTTSQTTDGCSGAYTVYFVVDGSESISNSSYEEVRNALIAFVNESITSNSNTRVGVVVYSDDVFAVINASSNINLLTNEIRVVGHPSSGTFTHLGIRRAKALLDAETSGNPHIMIVMTDGLSNYPADTKAAALETKNSGIRVFAVGVNPLLNFPSSPYKRRYEQELVDIASDNSTAIQIEDFSNLLNTVQGIVQSLCRDIAAITNDMRDVTLLSGTSAQLATFVDPPGVTNGVWRREGVDLTGDNRYTKNTIGALQSLTIPNVQTSQAGQYSYSVDGATTQATLTVLGRMDNFTRSVGDSQSFLVNVSPGVIAGAWFRNGVPLTSGAKYTIAQNTGTLRRITVQNIQTSDSGEYVYVVNGVESKAYLTVTETTVNGGFSEWSQWTGPCPVTCGSSADKTQTRNRRCDNPPRTGGGANCAGPLTETVTVNCGLSACANPDLTNQTVETGYAATFQVTLSETNVMPGSWFKDSTRLFNSVKTQISNRGRVQTLVVVNAQPVDSGVYRFSAGDVSTSASLNVLPTNCAADVVIVLDGSNFIITQTEFPKIKELLKQQINTTLQNFSNVRFGVVVYGRNVSGTIDLSSDPLSIKTQIDSLSVIGGGAYINLGISEARRLLVADQVSKSKHMIVVVGSLSSSPSDTVIAGNGIRSAGIQVKAMGVLGFFKTVPILYTQFKINLNAITSGVGSVTEFDNIPSFVNAFDVKSGICSSVVDGGLSSWSLWELDNCRVTCGVNVQTTGRRSRSCIAPTPQNGGLPCTGLLQEAVSRMCDVPRCPVNGTFTQWGQWDNPACGATCGQTATKTVRRTRICLPPQFGGLNCLGPLSETQEVSCGLGACPNASQHLCDNVQRQNDVGYRYHPSDCDKYVQCFFNPSGNVIGVYRSCPFGFYWNQVTFQCDESWKVSCPLERCTGSCAASYKLEGSCRSYWLCDGMKSVAKCCPQGFSFFPGHGCRANYYCDDLCPNTYSCREVCQKRPDWSGTAGIYNTFVESIGWKSGSCRSGTVFDIAECGCIDQRGCAITHDLDSRTPLLWLRATNVSINSGIATLVSTSRMYLDIKMTINTPVSVKLRFREAQAVSGRRILMSSSDCKKGNSLLITIEDQGIQFSVWSWYGDVTKMTIFTQGMSGSDWKTVNVGYNGRELSGVVESGRLTYMSKVMASNANIMECGLQVGGDNSSNTSAAFVGSIDTLQVSRCNPGLTP